MGKSDASFRELGSKPKTTVIGGMYDGAVGVVVAERAVGAGREVTIELSDGTKVTVIEAGKVVLITEKAYEPPSVPGQRDSASDSASE